MGKQVLSPAQSFKGWNFLTLMANHKDGVIATFCALIFVTLFIMMLVSPKEYDVLALVGQPSVAAGSVWTMLHTWLYWKNEQTKQ